MAMPPVLSPQTTIQNLLQTQANLPNAVNNGNPGTIYNQPQNDPNQPKVNQSGQPATFTGYNLLPQSQFMNTGVVPGLARPNMGPAAGGGMIDDILNRIRNGTPGGTTPGGGGTNPGTPGTPGTPTDPPGNVTPPRTRPAYGEPVGPISGSTWDALRRGQSMTTPQIGGTNGAVGGTRPGTVPGLVVPDTGFADSTYRGRNTQGYTGPGDAALVGGIPDVAGGYSGTTGSGGSISDALRNAFAMPRDADGSIDWGGLLQEMFLGGEDASVAQGVGNMVFPGLGSVIQELLDRNGAANNQQTGTASDHPWTSTWGQGTPEGGSYNFLANNPLAAMPNQYSTLQQFTFSDPSTIPTTPQEMAAAWDALMERSGINQNVQQSKPTRGPRGRVIAEGEDAQRWVENMQQRAPTSQQAWAAMDKMFGRQIQ